MIKSPIGVIGLGLLGSALAERLLHAGYVVIGFDIDAARRRALEAQGGKAAPSGVEVASCDRLLFCLPTSEVVNSVLGEIEPGLKEGSILIDTTTGDPECTTAIGASLAKRGVHYVDATILGSSQQARERDVLVIAGGESEVFNRCETLFACFARQCFHVGPWGAGARMKLIVNLVLGLNRAVLAEGLGLAKASGVDLELALRILQAGAAYSRVMDSKGRKMIEGDFKPQAKLAQHLKDVELILAQGQRAGTTLPLSNVHRDLLRELVGAGFGEDDNSAIIRAYSK